MRCILRRLSTFVRACKSSSLRASTNGCLLLHARSMCRFINYRSRVLSPAPVRK
jgi:hypothetical protein